MLLRIGRRLAHLRHLLRVFDSSFGEVRACITDLLRVDMTMVVAVVSTCVATVIYGASEAS